MDSSDEVVAGRVTVNSVTINSETDGTMAYMNGCVYYKLSVITKCKGILHGDMITRRFQIQGSRGRAVVECHVTGASLRCFGPTHAQDLVSTDPRRCELSFPWVDLRGVDGCLKANGSQLAF